MNEVLLMSIKTKYVKQIFAGIKRFEFRRKSIGDKNCNKKIYIYSSGVDKAIVGYILVDKILKGDVNYIIEETKCSDYQDITKYFDGCNECYALHINEFHEFLEPIKLDCIKYKYEKFVIPQFYRYIKCQEPIYAELENRKLKKNI